MEYDVLFRDMKNSLRDFFYANHLKYVFDGNVIKENYKIAGKNFVSLEQYWKNSDINLTFRLNLVQYLCYPLKNEKEHVGASVLICEYKDDELYRYFSLTDYLMYYHLKTIRFEECSGDTIKDKIIYYLDNVKEIILPILKGEVWLDSPTYWGNYK